MFRLASAAYGRLARLMYEVQPLPPLWITVLVTNRCNLACPFCPDREKRGRPDAGALTGQEWQKIVASVPPFTVVDLSSAEPFLAPDFRDIVDGLLERNRLVWICTNGTLLTREYARLLVRKKLRYLRVSLDGMREYHDRVRGLPGAFQRATQGLRWIREEKRSRSTTWPITAIKTNLLPDNAVEIPELLAFAENELQVDQVYFNLLYENELLTSQLPVRSLEHPTFTEGNTYHYPPDSIPAVQDAVRYIYEYAKTSKIVVGMSQDIPLADALGYVADPTGYGVRSCVEPWCGFALYYDGVVSPCVAYDVANIRDLRYDVKRVLGHPRYREYLSHFRKSGPFFPACGGCVVPHEPLPGR